MALDKKALRNLKLAEKRRSRRPEPSYVPPTTLRVTHGERKRITDTSAPLMLEIERRTVATARRIPELEDRHVEEAFRKIILKGTSEDPVTQELMREVEAMHARWTDETDPQDPGFIDVLRVLLDSVQTRSSERSPRSYLIYAEQFVNQH